MTDEPKLRILVNSNSHMSRGKYAAAAVHAALTAAGVHPGLPVIVLGGQKDHVLRCKTVIHDAGRTEVEPGTPTAGTDWEPEREWEYGWVSTFEDGEEYEWLSCASREEAERQVAEFQAEEDSAYANRAAGHLTYTLRRRLVAKPGPWLTDQTDRSL